MAGLPREFAGFAKCSDLVENAAKLIFSFFILFVGKMLRN